MPIREPEPRPPWWPRDVLIFGVGALGLRLAGSLMSGGSVAGGSVAGESVATGAAHGPSVGLAGTWPAGLAALRTDGLRMIDPSGAESRRRLPVYDRSGELPQVDLVVVAVKQHQTGAVAEAAARTVRADGLVLTLQNGLGADEILAAQVGPDRVVVGVTSAGATLVEPGVVRFAGAGETLIGGQQPGTQGWAENPSEHRGPCHAGPAKIEAIASLLTAAGLPARRVEDIRIAQWRKLAVNAAINGVTAVIRQPNGYLLASTPARGLALEAARETARVARAIGIPWNGDPTEFVDRVARDTATNRSSMLQDVLNGRDTETDAIHGAVVRAGQRAGIPTPVNAWLWTAVADGRHVAAETLPKPVPTGQVPA